jgi:hypothetical protein
MATDSPRAFVPPTPGVPKTLGILNIIFGLVLASCGIGMGIMLMFNPVMQAKMEASMKEVREQAVAKRKTQLADLDKREKAAKSEEEKKDIQEERKTLEEASKVPEFDPTKMVPQEFQTRMNRLTAVDAIAGLILNALFVASGIGLVMLKEWGRKIALWVAGVKLVRLAIFLAVFILVVIPSIVRMLDGMFGQITAISAQQAAAQGKAAPPALPPQARATMVQTAGIMYSSFAVVYVILALIYPGILLWMLTRPGAIAACQRRSWSGKPEPPAVEY